MNFRKQEAIKDSIVNSLQNEKWTRGTQKGTDALYEFTDQNAVQLAAVRAV
jgi:hypothetical protein